MNLVEVMEMFSTQEDCIAYLERLKWKPGSPECPQCGSTHVRRRNEQDTGRIGRWNCHSCRSLPFKVTHGEPDLSRDGNTASEVVSRYLIDGNQCEEKFVKLPVSTRSRTQAENMLAYDDGYWC